MYQIRMPGGEFMDTELNFNLQFELNNQVFSSSDATVLPGSFSFPSNIPLNGKNKRLLGDPQLVTNANKWADIEEVWVYAHGIPFFFGTLSIRECDARTAKVSIITNPVKQLKNVPLNTLDVGGVREIGNEAAMLAHAKATALDPLDYDYVFFPVYNRDFLYIGTGNPAAAIQNFYDTDTAAFSVDDDHPAFMPMIRLEYLLERIFAGIDYTFQNGFQINEELRRICLYNNQSMWTVDGLPTSIDLQKHLSKTTSTAFLRKLIGSFCLGLFTNPFTKHIRLLSLQQLAQAAFKYDWTQYAVDGYTIATAEKPPQIICWKEDSSDKAFEYYAKQVKPDPADVDGTINSSEFGTAADGIYFVYDRHAYYSIGVRLKHIYTTLGCAPTYTGDPKFEAELTALWDVFLYGEGFSPEPLTKIDLLPHVRIAGTVEYQQVPEGGGDPELVQQDEDCPDRITIYRGMYPDFDGDDYPMASGVPFDREGTQIGDYSLRWDEYEYGGMYQRFWILWHQILLSGKPITQTFIIPISELINFSFEYKIRMQNMDYFARSIKVNRLVSNKRVEIEVSLLSVI